MERTQPACAILTRKFGGSEMVSAARRHELRGKYWLNTEAASSSNRYSGALRTGFVSNTSLMAITLRGAYLRNPSKFSATLIRSAWNWLIADKSKRPAAGEVSVSSRSLAASEFLFADVSATASRERAVA